MNSNKTNEVLDIFQGFRMSPTPIDKYEEIGKSILHNKISSFVEKDEVIDFVMLGFPFKSTNKRDKVIGDMPDMAEQLTIENFSNFNNKVKEVYSPGVKIHMVSDGYVFNDILNTHNSIVAMYEEMSKDMIGNTPIEWYKLSDFYSKKKSLSESREKLIEHFGISGDQLEQRILMSPDVNFLYRGMVRFMEEEMIVRDYPSNSQLHKDAKRIARQMMFRNEAYSALVRAEFSNMIRISMHPSVNDGSKYSFKLIAGDRSKHSAWHCAIVIDQSGVMTIHKKDAEINHNKLIYEDGRPYYYEAN